MHSAATASWYSGTGIAPSDWAASMVAYRRGGWRRSPPCVRGAAIRPGAARLPPFPPAGPGLPRCGFARCHILFAQRRALGPLGGVLQQQLGKRRLHSVSSLIGICPGCNRPSQLPGAAARCCSGINTRTGFDVILSFGRQSTETPHRVKPSLSRDVAGFAGFWVTLAGMNHDLSLHQRRARPLQRS